MEGSILSGFLILGSYLVINGTLPIGEFVAAEIVIVSIIYSLKVFVKQIDYMYEMIEGLYKLNKLSASLSEDEHE
jgi:ABC-type bacteriocin/lantibiotic exporter with double-glycine peptidase domain